MWKFAAGSIFKTSKKVVIISWGLFTSSIIESRPFGHETKNQNGSIGQDTSPSVNIPPATILLYASAGKGYNFYRR
jgi:hypothetical protein